MKKADAHPMVDRIVRWLGDSPGPTAVHAGHFMLLALRDVGVPAILEELDGDDDARGLIEDLIARFPLTTWRLGVELTALLRRRGHDAGLLTLVNDWYFLRRHPDAATTLRKEFYERNQVLVPSYAQAMESAGLHEDALLRIGPHPVWTSEYWLRRRAERRLKRSDNPKLRVRTRSGGVTELVFDDLRRECRRLLCGGQADCAEEVSELLCLLREQGYKNLVNFVPRECEIPVNKGCTQAIELFDLADLRVLNIALPCLGGGFRDSRLVEDARVHSVFAERGDGGMIDAVVDSIYAARWIAS